MSSGLRVLGILKFGASNCRPMSGFDDKQRESLEDKFEPLYDRQNKQDLEIERLKGAGLMQDHTLRDVSEELKGMGQALREHVAQNGGAHRGKAIIEERMRDHVKDRHSFKAFSNIIWLVSKVLLGAAVIGTVVILMVEKF